MRFGNGPSGVPGAAPGGPAQARLLAMPAGLERWVGMQARAGGLDCLALSARSDAGPLAQILYCADGGARDRPLFRIGSQSKTLAVCSVLKLAERKLLRIEQPFASFFPELALPGGSPLRRVTLVQLMRHQSPLSRIERPMLQTSDGLYRQVPPRIGRKRLIRAIATGQSNARGRGRAAFDYSDFAIALLGLMVERVGGTDYGSFAEREILRPHGIADFFPAVARCPPPVAARLLRGHGHADDGDPVGIKPGDLDALNPAQGAVATADAACRFYQALLTGRLLAPQHTRLLLHSAIGFGEPDKGQRYSPGITHFPVGEVAAGDYCLGHLSLVGGFCGFTAHHPRTGITISLLMNALTTRPGAGSSPAVEANPAGFVRRLFQLLGSTEDAAGAMPDLWRREQGGRA